jgi:hypothetical protein
MDLASLHPASTLSIEELVFHLLQVKGSPRERSQLILSCVQLAILGGNASLLSDILDQVNIPLGWEAIEREIWTLGLAQLDPQGIVKLWQSNRLLSHRHLMVSTPKAAQSVFHALAVQKQLHDLEQVRHYPHPFVPGVLASEWIKLGNFTKAAEILQSANYPSVLESFQAHIDLAIARGNWSNAVEIATSCPFTVDVIDSIVRTFAFHPKLKSVMPSLIQSLACLGSVTFSQTTIRKLSTTYLVSDLDSLWYHVRHTTGVRANELLAPALIRWTAKNAPARLNALLFHLRSDNVRIKRKFVRSIMSDVTHCATFDQTQICETLSHLLPLCSSQDTHTLAQFALTYCQLSVKYPMNARSFAQNLKILVQSMPYNDNLRLDFGSKVAFNISKSFSREIAYSLLLSIVPDTLRENALSKPIETSELKFPQALLCALIITGWEHRSRDTIGWYSWLSRSLEHEHSASRDVIAATAACIRAWGRLGEVAPITRLSERFSNYEHIKLASVYALLDAGAVDLAIHHLHCFETSILSDVHSKRSQYTKTSIAAALVAQHRFTEANELLSKIELDTVAKNVILCAHRESGRWEDLRCAVEEMDLHGALSDSTPDGATLSIVLSAGLRCSFDHHPEFIHWVIDFGTQNRSLMYGRNELIHLYFASLLNSRNWKLIHDQLAAYLQGEFQCLPASRTLASLQEEMYQRLCFLGVLDPHEDVGENTGYAQDECEKSLNRLRTVLRQEDYFEAQVILNCLNLLHSV